MPKIRTAVEQQGEQKHQRQHDGEDGNKQFRGPVPVQPDPPEAFMGTAMCAHRSGFDVGRATRPSRHWTGCGKR